MFTGEAGGRPLPTGPRGCPGRESSTRTTLPSAGRAVRVGVLSS